MDEILSELLAEAVDSPAAPSPLGLSALIVGAGGERFALPQNGVVELVHVGPRTGHHIETICGARMLRRRDRLLPLVSLARILDLEEPASVTETICVIVAQVGAREIGLIVDQVLDTEEIVVSPLSPLLGGLKVYSGNTILGDGSVVMILDLDTLAAAVDAPATGAAEDRAVGATAVETGPRRILLVDNSAFIRNLLAPLLRAEGYEVVAADSPSEALRRRDAGEMFDLVISAIEMPGIDGFDLVESCRAAGPWQKVAFIALTSQDAVADTDRAKEAGFDHHVGKLDTDTLLRLTAAAGPAPRAVTRVS